MNLPIYILKERKEAFQTEFEKNDAEIRKLQDANTCLRAKIQELDEGIDKLSVSPAWPTVEP